MGSCLTPFDREFFNEVSAAALANPFSSQRRELDTRIAGTMPSEPQRVHRLRDAVKARVARLEQSGKAHLKQYRGDEALVMRNVFLFETYHSHCDALDELIAEQLKAGDSSCVVRFARDALGDLSGRGFTEEEATRFFSIFFQL